MPKTTKKMDSVDVTRILQSGGMIVPEFARFVDRYGMIRFVKRESGLKAVERYGWREVSRGEAERIQRENTALKRNYLKPKARKFY